MHKHRLVALAIGLSAILAACSSSGASTAPSAAAPSAAPSAAASAPAASAPAASASAPAAAAGTTIALADSSLGKIIVDGKGMTLYEFVPDEDQPASTCLDKCLAAWPALIADSPTAGPGLDASKLSVVARTDGKGNQVKYGEYFLYTFAADKAPGDVNGQNVGPGKWWVLGADGEPIKQ